MSGWSRTQPVVGRFLDAFGFGSLGGYGAVRDVAEIEARE
jgi:hypothetical protein